MADMSLHLTPGRTNVSRDRFVTTLRTMHAAKWGQRTPAPEPEPEPAPLEDRRLTPDEVAEVVRLRRERASYWTWKRLGERYGVDGYAVKLAVLGRERHDG